MHAFDDHSLSRWDVANMMCRETDVDQRSLTLYMVYDKYILVRLL